jgi:hypothetical protein
MKIYKITEARGGRKKKNKAENEPDESNGI